MSAAIRARASRMQVVRATLRRVRRGDAARSWSFCRARARSCASPPLLGERVKDPDVDIAPLYGAMDGRRRTARLRPAPPGRRKMVLATSIAETSLTIEGVRVVVDCGLLRVPRFEPDIGLTRLETVRVSRANADQRRGRAGRTEPGVCYRLWEEAANGGLAPFAQPEILAADLSGFALDLAAWGVARPGELAFLDPPPRAALAEARALLTALGALDDAGRITEEGRAMSPARPAAAPGAHGGRRRARRAAPAWRPRSPSR